MPQQNFQLIGGDAAVVQLSLDSRTLQLPNCTIEFRTLQTGLSAGVQTLTLDNGCCTVTVLPTRGMGLLRAHCGGDFGWRSPVRGPVHPQFVPLAEPSGLGWLDGFNELFCRCGLVSNGAPQFDERGILQHGLHGRIANLPAHSLVVTADSEAGELRVTGVVEETRFLCHSLRLTSTLVLHAGEPGFRIIDEVTNFSTRPGEMELLYHINFGPGASDSSGVPLLEAGAKLVAPVKTLVPRNARAAEGVQNWDTYGPPEAGFAEQVYFLELAADDNGNTQTLLRNAAGSRGVSLRFNTREQPCFTLWKNTGSLDDGYVTGLEPGLNFPNVRSFEKTQGRVKQLASGETVHCELAFDFHRDAAEVARAERAIAQLQSGIKPTFFEQPQPGWCG